MKSKENDETGRKRKQIKEKHFECREKLKLVEKLRPDRPGKILAPEKKKKFDRYGRAGPVTLAPGRKVLAAGDGDWPWLSILFRSRNLF